MRKRARGSARCPHPPSSDVSRGTHPVGTGRCPSPTWANVSYRCPRTGPATRELCGTRSQRVRSGVIYRYAGRDESDPYTLPDGGTRIVLSTARTPRRERPDCRRTVIPAFPPTALGRPTRTAPGAVHRRREVASDWFRAPVLSCPTHGQRPRRTPPSARGRTACSLLLWWDRSPFATPKPCSGLRSRKDPTPCGSIMTVTNCQ